MTVRVLPQDQVFAAQEWPFRPGPRTAKMWVEEPPAGINGETGLMLVLHNWGGVYDDPEYQHYCRTYAVRYNVIALSVNYLQSGPDWGPPPPYDHGYLQAMDAIRAAHAVWRQLRDRGVAWNERRIYAMGGSGGGNVTQMALKLAPHTFACGVDICGMPGLIDAIAYGTGDGTALNAGYSRDPASPAFLSADMQEIRDFGHPAHCRLLHAANPALKIVIVHGTEDASCPCAPKIAQCQAMRAAGLDVDGHFLTVADVDGRIITTTGHAVGDREQVVIHYADAYLLPTSADRRLAPEPNDFTRGGVFTYPTRHGRYEIDFSGPPLIAFVRGHDRFVG